MDPLSISLEDSVAIVESQGFMAAARLVQLLSNESRARVVAVSPMNAAGAITTVIAGPLAEVQYALTLARSGNAISDSTFFARPQIDTIEMLLRSAFGNSMTSNGQAKKPKSPEPLPLFEAPAEQVRQQPRQVQQIARELEPVRATEPVRIHQQPKPAPVAQRANGVAKPQTNGSAEYESKPLYELEKYPVHELRRYARSISGFPIHGREISKANRAELLQLIKTAEERSRTQAAREAIGDAISHEELTSNITPN